MTTKTLEEVKELAKGYDLVPIQEEIFADLVTPIQLLRKIAAGKKNYYLLESVEGGEKWGRYSFLGYDPVMRVSCKENTVTIKQRQETKTVETDDCFQVLRDILAEHKAPKIEGMPPFAGGFVGYFAYAMIAQAEKKLSVKRGEFEDYDLMMFDKVILKSGAEFTVKCDKFTLERNGLEQVTGYNISGITENKPVYLDFDEVAAIVRVLSDEADAPPEDGGNEE